MRTDTLRKAQYSSAAVDQLVGNMGEAALGNWVRASKNGANPSGVFSAGVGASLEAVGEALGTQVK